MKSDTLSAVSSDIQVITNSRGTVKAIRVGAYCRVSTKMEQQKKSIETQIAAYERIICQHPGWKLADIYADADLLQRANEAVKELMEEDRYLDKPEHASVRQKLEQIRMQNQTVSELPIL